MASRLRVLSVGRSKRGPFAELDDEYTERIARLAPFVREHVPQSRRKRDEERRQDEGRALLERIGDDVLIALDVGGKAQSSPAFAASLATWRREGKGVSFVIGGPDGLSEELRRRARFLLSLGTMTLPHDLALVVLLEQIYRALLHDAGHPYSRH